MKIILTNLQAWFHFYYYYNYYYFPNSLKFLLLTEIFQNTLISTFAFLLLGNILTSLEYEGAPEPLLLLKNPEDSAGFSSQENYIHFPKRGQCRTPASYWLGSELSCILHQLCRPEGLVTVEFFISLTCYPGKEHVVHVYIQVPTEYSCDDNTPHGNLKLIMGHFWHDKLGSSQSCIYVEV